MEFSSVVCIIGFITALVLAVWIILRNGPGPMK